MPRKDEFLSQLLSSKTQEIVSSPRNYTAFLQTAAQNYSTAFRSRYLSTPSARMPPPVRKSVCGTGWVAG